MVSLKGKECIIMRLDSFELNQMIDHLKASGIQVKDPRPYLMTKPEPKPELQVVAKWSRAVDLSKAERKKFAGLGIFQFWTERYAVQMARGRTLALKRTHRVAQHPKRGDWWLFDNQWPKDADTVRDVVYYDRVTRQEWVERIYVGLPELMPVWELIAHRTYDRHEISCFVRAHERTVGFVARNWVADQEFYMLESVEEVSGEEMRMIDCIAYDEEGNEIRGIEDFADTSPT